MTLKIIWNKNSTMNEEMKEISLNKRKSIKLRNEIHVNIEGEQKFVNLLFLILNCLSIFIIIYLFIYFIEL